MVCFLGKTGCDLVIFAALLLSQAGKRVLVCDQSEEKYLFRLIPKPEEVIPVVHCQGVDFCAWTLEDALAWAEGGAERYDYCLGFSLAAGKKAADVVVTDWHREAAALAREEVGRRAGSCLVIRDVKYKSEAELILSHYPDLGWDAGEVYIILVKDRDREARIWLEYGKLWDTGKLTAEFRGSLVRLLKKVTGLTGRDLPT